jgi:predicted transcriptional regulator of viral defense system
MLLDFSMLKSGSKVRVGVVASRQWGRVTWAQLADLGVPEGTISLWIDHGYLHPRLPRVYAVGHAATTTEAQLAEALLYAGPGAMLSHATAAWWLGLLDERPRAIHVSTPRQPRSLPGIRVHRRRTLDRVWHKRFTVTTLPQTIVDFSARAPLWGIRRVLAQADYKDVLDIQAIDAALGPGRRGSAKLRQALQRHRPELARTKSRLERMFFEICEQQGWPLPELNEYVAGWEVDARWRDKKIAIELDGHGNHHTPAQRRRDRRKEMALRAAGWTPVRYSEEQLEERTDVIADIQRLRGAP